MKLFFIADPAVKRVVDFQKWFEKRLDDAIQAAEKDRPKTITYEEVIAEEKNKDNEIKNDKIIEDNTKKEQTEKIVKPIIKSLEFHYSELGTLPIHYICLVLKFLSRH